MTTVVPAYADSMVCPNCRRSLGGAAVCPHCGLMLASWEGGQVWSSLVEVDRLLAAVPHRPIAPRFELAAGQAVRYADPAVCPACRQPISGVAVCPHCEFVLASPDAGRVWDQLVRIDQVLAAAPHQQVVPQGTRRGPGVEAVLLALGAGLILVAALTFISVSWGSLGLLGRTAVLAGVTAVAAAVAIFVTRRGLRGTAEALWVVALGLLVLDWFAIWHERDALKLGFLDLGPWSVLLAFTMTGLTVAVTAFGATRLHAKLWGPEVVAAVTVFACTIALGGDLIGTADWRVSWAALSAAALGGVIALIARRGRLPLLMWASLAVGAMAVVVALVAALFEVFLHPTIRGLLLEAHAVPALVLAAVAIVIGLKLPRTATGACVVAGLLLVAVFVAPWIGEGDYRWGNLAAALIAVVLVLVARGRGRWWVGLRILAAIVMSYMVLIYCAVALASLAVVGKGLVRSGGRPFDQVRGIDTGSQEWWSLAACVVASLVGVVAVRWWPAPTIPRRWSDLVAPLATGMGIVGILTISGGPWLVYPLVLVVTGAVSIVQFRKAASSWRVPGTVLAIAALAYATAEPVTASIVFLAVGVVLALAAALCDRQGVAGPHLAGAAGALTMGGVLLADGLGAPASAKVLAVVAVVAFLVLIAHTVVRRQLELRIWTESTAAVLALVAFVSGEAVLASGWAAVVAAVLSVIALVAAATVDDRLWYALVAAPLITVAWINVMVSADVHAIEAITVPLAAIALTVGGVVMHRSARTRTWLALGPGLLIAAIPSLPAAMAEPTSLRAALLGVAALVALALGTWRGWQAPFIMGAVVIGLLLLANVGPWALAVQRWALFAALGAGLLAVGATWEDRVRQGRAAVRRLADMR